MSGVELQGEKSYVGPRKGENLVHEICVLSHIIQNVTTSALAQLSLSATLEAILINYLSRYFAHYILLYFPLNK